MVLYMVLIMMNKNKFTQIHSFISCSYDRSSRRKQHSDRSKRSHHRRSPASQRRGAPIVNNNAHNVATSITNSGTTTTSHRHRHRDDRSHSTSRRRHRELRDRAKEREDNRITPVKVKQFHF